MAWKYRSVYRAWMWFATEIAFGIAAPFSQAAAGSTCADDLVDSEYVSISGEHTVRACNGHCLVTPIASGDTPDTARSRKAKFDSGKSGPLDVWIHYRNQSAAQSRIQIQAAPGKQATGVVPVSTKYRWDRPVGPSGQPISLELQAGSTEVGIESFLNPGDSIDCLYLRAADEPLPKLRALVEIDKVWTGTRVDFDAVSRSGFVFIGYYDSNRWLHVAQVNLSTYKVQTVQLQSQFVGWDSHNYVRVALDADGYVHVAANMHGSPLTYFRSARPLSIEGMARAAMTGRDESRVTYPTFVKAPKGRLFFAFRDGVSGDGSWFVNAWDGEKWSRLPKGALFADHDAYGPVSAYPSEFVAGSDGLVHVAAMWRRPGGDVSSNFRITHAATTDFVTWRSASGDSLTLPLGPNQGDIVDDPGPRAGLINTQHLSVTSDGRPAVVYSKYSPDGKNAAYLRFFDSGKWSERLLGAARTRTEIRGQGSLGKLPGLKPLAYGPQGIPQVIFAFPGAPAANQIDLDPKTLSPLAPPQLVQDTVQRGLLGFRSDLADAVVMSEPVRESDEVASDPRWFLQWSTQNAFNDRPRTCGSPTKDACHPAPDILRLIRLGP